jgi:hypothetical protein
MAGSQRNRKAGSKKEWRYHKLLIEEILSVIRQSGPSWGWNIIDE